MQMNAQLVKRPENNNSDGNLYEICNTIHQSINYEVCVPKCLEPIS